MDDNFLYQLQEQPDPQFVKTLHSKLTQNEPDSAWRLTKNVFSSFRRYRLVQATVVLVIALIAIMAISPARAVVTSVITNIAGQLFEVTGNYPGDTNPDDEEIIESQVMPLSEALAAFPYEIQLPTQIPSGYVLDEDHVRVYVGKEAGPFVNSIEFRWLSDTQANLTLRITDDDQRGISEVVAPDSLEEIQLDSAHSAVLIRGGWDADLMAWRPDVGRIRLSWMVGNLSYDLMGIDQDQLIEIALSTLQ